MKLGYDLTTEQTQKLVMTTELVQAIKILQFNAQELDTYVNEQLLANPVLEHAEQDDSVKDAELEDHSSQEDTGQQTEALEEYLWERGLDDISYRQGKPTQHSVKTYSWNTVLGRPVPGDSGLKAASRHEPQTRRKTAL